MAILNLIVAAIAAQTTVAAQAATTSVEKSISVWDLTLKGGVIMIPLAIMAVISIYILIERTIVITKAAKEDKTFMQKIKDYIHDGEVDSAMNLCKKEDTPYSRLILKGITRIGRPMNDVLVAIENVGNMEVASLEKGFAWLATTAAAAPMLGFLGTVTGMVQAFFAMANAGSAANISILAGGIYEALVTTVGGLVVGIVALLAYNYLVSRVHKVMNKLEAKTMEFMDLLNEPSK